MRLHVGTCGYSYKEWKPGFYPPDLRQDAMLAYYSERFDCVEINSTYYRLPRSSVLEQWAATVPPEFRFALKASKRITHDQRLSRADDLVGYLLRTVETLGERLGPLLFQTPESFRCDLPRLVAFLALLPRDRRCTFEFRHASWHDDEVRAALRDRDMALCVTDDLAADAPGELPLVSTAGWGYLRLMRVDYSDEQLADIARAVHAMPWSDAYVFFKHHTGEEGPRLAASLRAAFATL
ncbi:MAG: DUF72 domain-containing protein [Myxococcales bacterium]|nr:DUF72 domain-containing protein [Myxococcales bacterium]